MKNNKISGIVLSAGLSGRMNSFKPLLKLGNGKTFLQSVIENLIQICDEIVVVTGFRSVDITNHIHLIFQSDKLKVVFNEDYQKGMFTSLRSGLENSNADCYLYHFVDQPSLPIEFYYNFIQQIDKEVNWIQPTFETRKGHPILFDKFVKEKILISDSSQNLREISRNESIQKKLWECSTDLIFQDIDTEKEYSELAV